MARMKTFITFAIIVVAFIVFSDFCIFATLKLTYEPFKQQIIATKDVYVTVQDGQKTYMNGYIKGAIENKTNETITDQYLKFEFFSDRDNSLGAKYIRVDELKSGEKRDFEVKYNIQDTSYYVVTEIAASEAGDIPEEEFSMDIEISFYHVLAAMVMLYFL